MKILLIRHGDPDYEHDTLTEQGWREAELLAQRMKTIPVDGFYLSPLGRAQATASVSAAPGSSVRLGASAPA